MSLFFKIYDYHIWQACTYTGDKLNGANKASAGDAIT